MSIEDRIKAEVDKLRTNPERNLREAINRRKAIFRQWLSVAEVSEEAIRSMTWTEPTEVGQDMFAIVTIGGCKVRITTEDHLAKHPITGDYYWSPAGYKLAIGVTTCQSASELGSALVFTVASWRVDHDEPPTETSKTVKPSLAKVRITLTDHPKVWDGDAVSTECFVNLNSLRADNFEGIQEAKREIIRAFLIGAEIFSGRSMVGLEDRFFAPRPCTDPLPPCLGADPLQDQGDY